MPRAIVTTLPFLLLIAPATTSSALAQRQEDTEREEMYRRYLRYTSYIKPAWIEPHWFADGNTFWYASGARDSIVIYKVDPVANAKANLFEVARLRSVLAEELGKEPPGKGVPFPQFAFTDENEEAVRFTIEEREFVLRLDTYAVSEAPASDADVEAPSTSRVLRQGTHGRPDIKEVLSPDGQWLAHLKEHNLWLRSTSDDGLEQITHDGTPEHYWGYGGINRAFERELAWAWWSPDSRKLLVRKGDFRGVRKIPIVDWLDPAAEVEWVQSVHNVESGGTLPGEQLFVLDVSSRRLVSVDLGATEDQYLAVLGWMPDASEVFIARVDREYRQLDLLAANAQTGDTRVILIETAETFVGSPLWLGSPPFVLLEDGTHFIWSSERDGWHHHYLYQTDGTLVRQLTAGSFIAGGVITVDESNGWVYFYCFAGERPYDAPVCRGGLDGEGFTLITEPVGRHWPFTFSPSTEFFLDTYSSVGAPPVVELRRSDGTLVQTLARADISTLIEQLHWQAPEPFAVKAADGETDLYGVLYKPYDFDPTEQYPVLEYIYGGPFRNNVSHAFYQSPLPLAWAQLGFIVFVVDGRGTPERSKAFQDVTYGNVGRHEIPDHVAALRQLAADRPYMDLERVGIIGSSFGGYFATRALLLAPDVYHVGIAVCPAADLYGKATVMDQYMGLPESNAEGYAYASNTRLAEQLDGKLLLIHGTSDVNAPISETMKMVDALIHAGKPFDLLVLPNHDHRILGARGPRGEYAREAVRRYLFEHLRP
jgi:dipeptidyl aminopeptidase/acylaminoacyl peptidase